MRSKTATSVLHASPSKTSAGAICAGILFASLMTTVEPASALIPQAHGSLQNQVKQDSPITEVYVRRGGGARRTTVVGPRGGVASRTVVRGGAVVRPGVVRPGVVRPGGWVRPAHYYWRPGGAIAAGAAIGVRGCGHRCSLGGFATCAWLLLVLHRSEPDAGVLGRLPVTRPSGVRAMTLLRTDPGPDDRSSEDSRTDDMVRIPGGTFRMGSDKHYPGGSAGPPGDGGWLLDRPHAGDEPAIQGIRQGDRSQDVRRDPARSKGLPRRAAAHALCRLAGVLAAAAASRICATGASGGSS